MAAQVVKSADTRRLRMERDALENMLFGLFERQPAWPFMQLEKETNQPVPWLKVRPGPRLRPYAQLFFSLNRLGPGSTCASIAIEKPLRR